MHAELAPNSEEFHFTPFVLTMYGVGAAFGAFVFLLLFFKEPVLKWGDRIWPYFDLLGMMPA